MSPAISVNKESLESSVSIFSCPGGSLREHKTQKNRLPSATTNLSIGVPERDSGWKEQCWPQTTEMHIKGNDFNEARLLYLPHTQKNAKIIVRVVAQSCHIFLEPAWTVYQAPVHRFSGKVLVVAIPC